MFRTTHCRATAPICLSLMAVPIALALSASKADAATPSGRCVSARIEAPFRLPDGRLYPAATLTLCDSRAFSPIANVHRTYVDGRPAGMFTSRTRRGEATRTAAPSVVFQTSGEGPLDLLGYVLPTEGRDVSYQLGVSRHASAMSAGVATASAPIALVVAAK